MKMTRNAARIILILAMLMTALLGTVFAENTASVGNWADYAGHMYAGPDPWEGQLTVEIESIEDGRMTWTLTDDFGLDTTLQAHMETGITHGVSAFHIEGAIQENDYTTFDYAGTIALADGSVIVTFTGGQLTEHSPYGGSTAYHVAALENDARTVVLRRVVPGGSVEAE